MTQRRETPEATYRSGIASIVASINLGYTRTLDEVHKDLVQLCRDVDPAASSASVIAEPTPFCKAQEWQRDGRGLCAERHCTINNPPHAGKHEFSAWRYNVQPPTTTASVIAEMQTLHDEMRARAQAIQDAGAVGDMEPDDEMVEWLRARADLVSGLLSRLQKGEQPWTSN